MTAPAVRQSDHDACPGALRLHAAADGPLARVRLPGGLLTGAQLAALRTIAEEWGDGHVELTSRGNLQLRALTGAPAADLAAAVHAAGLLPSRTHEVVRNIAASPLPAVPDIRPLVRALDVALCAEPRLAGLPGRFLFALDSGAGDVATAADVASYRSTIWFAGRDVGLSPGPVVPAMIAAAHAFLDERAAQGSAAWRLHELDDGPARVAARTAATLGLTLGAVADLPVAGGPDPIGLVAQPDGRMAVGALVPLGRLGGVPMSVLAEAEQIVVTPWRGVLLPDLTTTAAESWRAAVAGAGLEVAAGSRWTGVTTCAGRPGCAKALADVRGDAQVATRYGAGLPVHWIGCARGCGSPAGDHVRVEATGDGYRVTAPGSAGPGFARPRTAAEVGALIAAARRS